MGAPAKYTTEELRKYVKIGMCKEEILEKTDAFFQNFSARYSNVLQKLAE